MDGRRQMKGITGEGELERSIRRRGTDEEANSSCFVRRERFSYAPRLTARRLSAAPDLKATQRLRITCSHTGPRERHAGVVDEPHLLLQRLIRQNGGLELFEARLRLNRDTHSLI